MGTKKRYDELLNHKYDAPACDAVMHYLEQQGLVIARNPEKYAADIVVYSGYRPSQYVEVEVRRGWRGSQFPRAWNPIHVLERKIHLFIDPIPTDLYIVSECYKHAIVVPGTAILRAHGRGLHEISNSEVQKGEMFLTVPIEECIDILLSGEVL